MNDLLSTKEQRPAGDEPLRQLFIGVDAMEWTLVQRWAAEGKLPTFRRLLEEGARAELSTTGQYLPGWSQWVDATPFLEGKMKCKPKKPKG